MKNKTRQRQGQRQDKDNDKIKPFSLFDAVSTKQPCPRQYLQENKREDKREDKTRQDQDQDKTRQDQDQDQDKTKQDKASLVRHMCSGVCCENKKTRQKPKQDNR
jgi:hypothetical protein